MNALILCLPLLFADPASIEFAWAQATACEPEQKSIVADHIAEPRKMVTPPAKPAQQFKTETRYRTVRKRFCTSRGCYYRWVREPYQVKVPVASAANKNWPRYPTTPRQQPWTQGGRHITWRHLSEGEHKNKFDTAWLQSLTQAEVEQLHADDHEHVVKWAYVVRP